MAQELQTLLVRIDADIERLRRGLKGADGATQRAGRNIQKRTTAIERSFQRMGKQVATSLAAFAGIQGIRALSNMAQQSIRTADELGKTADRIGFNVEAFQELTFAAQQSGVSLTEFNTAMTALVRRSGEAIAGNKTYVKAFKDLGISITELRNLSPDQLLNRVSDAVNRLGSQAEKLAALDRVMSETGRRMVNMTDEGSRGLAKLRREAREAGLVLDESMVREAEKANDALSKLSTQINVNMTGAFVNLSPAIIDGTEKLAGFTEQLQDTVEELTSGELKRAMAELGKLMTFSPAASIIKGKPSTIAGLFEGDGEKPDNGGGVTIAMPPRPDAPGPSTPNVSPVMRPEVLKEIEVQAEKIREAFGGIGDAINQNDIAFDIWQRNMADGFADVIVEARSLGDVLTGLLKQLAKAELSNLFSSALGLEKGGSILGGLFGGERADGGPVLGGKAYLVGERGPELFIPKGAGDIAPNHSLGGGQTVVVNQSITQRFDVGLESVDSRITQAAPTIVQAARDGTLSALNRMGPRRAFS